MKTLFKNFSWKQFIFTLVVFAIVKLLFDYFLFEEKSVVMYTLSYWVTFSISSILFSLLFCIFVVTKKQ